MAHSEDDDTVSESQHPMLARRNINFPIEEHQSESVQDSMYETKYEGYESSKSPLKKKVVAGKRSMISN